MPHKHLLFRAEAREKVLRGATALADTVRVTLGPRSRSVLIEKKWGKPIVCNDGVTIAKEFSLEDADEDLGAQMIRGAAERTGDAVGDGTTTATILAHAILADGVRNIAAGASAIDLRRGLDGGVKVAVEALRAQSKPVQTFREKQQVATVSGHNDAEAGDLVARAIDKVGAEGAVTLDESKGTETTLDIVEGLQFDRGYLSPYFVTDPEKMEAVLEEPFILLHQAKIASLKDLLPLLEQIAKQGASLLVIAEDVEGEALATLVVNKLRGIFVNVAVKAAGFGDRRQAMLQDIAVLTGGQLVAQELGIRLENVTPALLGRASRVIVDREHTTIIGGHGDRHAIDGRCQELRKQIADATSDYDREKLEERLAKLSGGVAVIYVGAPSEAEMKSRHEALDDAVHATRAAMAKASSLVPDWRCCARSPPSKRPRPTPRGTSIRAFSCCAAPSRRPPARLPRTPASTAASSSRRCAPAVAISDSTPPADVTSTWWRRASSIRRRWCAWRSRTRSRSLESSCSPKPR
jgi:chaperonin GroEL